MNLFWILSGWLAGILTLIVLLDYFKNVRKFERLIERFFIAFLKLERSSENFSHQYLEFFFHEIRRAFYASSSVFFTLQNDCVRMEHKIGNYPKDTFYLDWKKGQSIALPLNIKKKIKIQRLKAYLLKNKKYCLILPLYHHKKLSSFFIFIHKNPLSFYRDRKLIFLHSLKFRLIAFDIIKTMRERQQDYTQAMLSSIKDYAFITLTEDLRIKTWNRGAEVLFGLLPQDAADRKITSLLETNSRKHFIAEMPSIREREEWKGRLKVEDCNKNEFVTEAVLKTMKIDEMVIGFYLILKDVTQEEVWKNNLKKQSLLNKSIIENTGDGILMINAENRIIFCNDKIRTLFEHSYSFLGMLVDVVIPDVYKKPIQEILINMQQEKKTDSHLELKIGEQDYLIRFFPILDKGSCNGFILFFIDQTAMVVVREKMRDMNKNLLEHLSAARTLHQNLIPQQLPNLPGWKCAKLYLPSQELGGDFYYTMPVDTSYSKELAVLVADVSGHGLGASMLTVLVKDVFMEFIDQYQKNDHYPITHFLENMNRKLHHLETESTRFITVFLVFINLENGQTLYSSAGHPKALLFQKNKIVPFGIKNAPPLGVVEDYPYTSESVKMENGDRLTLLTDGISDLFSMQNLSFEAYLELNRNKNPDKLINDIETDISKMINHQDKETQDDLTMVIVDREHKA